MLKNNDWIILNAITFKIHSIEDFDEMRLSLMKQLSYIIDYDSSSFYTANPLNERELERPVGINYNKSDMEEYINCYKNMDYSEGLMFTGKNIAYRESDIIPEEVRINSQYYKAVYNPMGWHYSLHLNICKNEKFLGVMSFFRNKGKENFSYDDIFTLDMLKDHLALRLYNEQCRILSEKLDFSKCAVAFSLSVREEAVLKELLTDKTIDTIAKELCITVNTLRKHCNNIYKKLHINNRIQLFDMIKL